MNNVMNTSHQTTNLLRRSLKANAAFSFLSGLTFTFAHGPISKFLGLTQPVILLIIGISLLVFALGLFRNAVRETIKLSEATIAVILDFGWVLGSVVILSLGLLTTSGNWALMIVADVVLLFAILQFLGLRKIKQVGD